MSRESESVSIVADLSLPRPSSPQRNQLLLDLLRVMQLAREGDRREEILVREQKGAFHMSCSGHEAIAALAYHLKPNDLIFPYYRDRALMHVRGMELCEFADDFLACEKSSSSGRNLPSHVSCRRLNVFSITSPVGSQCLPAVGAAWGIKKTGSDAIVTCHLGDASTRQGEFYEAVCFATERSLPILFVIEDNGYGISTPTSLMTPLALRVFEPDMITVTNGRDPEQLLDVSGSVIRDIRMRGRPRILWCELERLCDHTVSDDQRVYRSKSEIEASWLGDPIEILANRLTEEGVVDLAYLATMKAEIHEQVLKAYDAEESELPPQVRDVQFSLFAPASERCHIDLSPTPSPRPNTILSAVNWTLGRILDEEPGTVIFGEDVEDPKGGVFGITKSLSTCHPGRVHNSPLAEATIVGAGVGLAASGYRPIVELQFIDFVGPAYNQLSAQVTNLRWRTSGHWTCPLILYATYGAYLPGGGMWHSQSNEGLFAHMPGLRVAVPSTPEDASGLFWSAIQEQDPTLILLPKHLLRLHQEPYTVGFQPIPFGKARVARVGADCTVVAWGNCVPLAINAAMQLEVSSGVSAEVIDLRSIVPCDWVTLSESLRKTGRLVVVQEDVRTCGFGQAVVAELLTNAAGFDSLYAAPVLISRPDVHIPYCSKIELLIMPTVDSIVKGVKQALS